MRYRCRKYGVTVRKIIIENREDLNENGTEIVIQSSRTEKLQKVSIKYCNLSQRARTVKQNRVNNDRDT